LSVENLIPRQCCASKQNIMSQVAIDGSRLESCGDVISCTASGGWTTVNCNRVDGSTVAVTHRDVRAAHSVNFAGAGGRTLLVIHGEELPDARGRFALGDHDAVISCCGRDGNITALALTKVDPRGTFVGPTGLYIHGQPLAAASQLSPVRSLYGVRFEPCADVWWMPHALGMAPVFVRAAPQLDCDEDEEVGADVHRTPTARLSALPGPTPLSLLRAPSTPAPAVNGRPIGTFTMCGVPLVAVLSTDGARLSIAATEIVVAVNNVMLWHHLFAVDIPGAAATEATAAEPSVAVAANADGSARLHVFLPGRAVFVIHVPAMDAERAFTDQVGLLPPLPLFTIDNVSTAPIVVPTAPGAAALLGVFRGTQLQLFSAAGSASPGAPLAVHDIGQPVTQTFVGAPATFRHVSCLTPAGGLASVTFPCVQGDALVADALAVMRAVLSQEEFDSVVHSVALAHLQSDPDSDVPATGNMWDAVCAAVLPASATPAPAGAEEDANLALDPFLIVVPVIAAGAPPAASAGAPVALPTASRGLATLGLHLLFESYRLQRTAWPMTHRLGALLFRLSADLGLTRYTRFYAGILVLPEPAGGPSTTLQNVVPPAAVEQHFTDVAATLHGAPPEIHLVLRMYLDGGVRGGLEWPRFVRDLPAAHPIMAANRAVDIYRNVLNLDKNGGNVDWCGVVQAVLDAGWTASFVNDVLAPGVAHPLQLALHACREKPCMEWSPQFLGLIGRHDIVRAQLGAVGQRGKLRVSDIIRHSVTRATRRVISDTPDEDADDDGVLLPTEYSAHWRDNRAEVVQSLLNTSVPISLPSGSDGSDVAQNLLKNLTRRSMALPVGRGMMAMATQNFRVRDIIPTPKLTLTGETSDGLTISNEAAALTPDKLLWPQFHNGCAAGLRYLPLGQHGPRITRHWIVYQTRDVGNSTGRAGLLLAVGLLGHLSSLQYTDIYTMLIAPASKGTFREPMTIAVMLGLCCSFRGQRTDSVFRCISVHIQSLTPNAEDLEVSLDVQTAAILSIGLLHQGSCSSFFAEMLLNEISRTPTDEHCKNREGYALAAGMSLGLLLLGRGRNHGLGNLQIEDRLFSYLDGLKRNCIPSHLDGTTDLDELFSKEDHFLTRSLMNHSRVDTSAHEACNSVFEGNHYNTAVTAPACVVALGIIFLQTGDTLVAQKLALPKTMKLMETVTPSTAMLRVMCASLVMWSSMRPAREWIYDNLPVAVTAFVRRLKTSTEEPSPKDLFHTVNVGHGIAGAVLALGMRYAGTLLSEAKDAIMDELRGFVDGEVGTTGVKMTLLQKKTGVFEWCISSCCIALALVLAGTGDMQALAVLKRLHKRTSVHYGQHMAVGMAIGLVFLGGGRCTISNSLESVAALIIAFYPVWPRDSTDNVYHLQVLRQLYALCVVPRWIEVIDVETNQPVSVSARLVLVENSGRVKWEQPQEGLDKTWTPMPRGRENQALTLVTPCLLPDLSTIDHLEIRSVDHYPLNIEAIDTTGGSKVVIAVLRKPATGIARWGGGAADTLSIEERAWDDMLHVFGQQSTHAVVSAALLESLSMLLSTDNRLALSVHGAGAAVSDDFVGKVRRSLQRRFSALFAPRLNSLMGHRTAGCDAPEMHVVRAIVMNFEEVWVAAAKLLRGKTVASGNSVADPAEHFQVARWIHQALLFYGLSDTTFIPTAIRTYLPQLQSHALRSGTLTKLYEGVKLPLATLDLVVGRCVDFADTE
jgi:hypothetical protein